MQETKHDSLKIHAKEIELEKENVGVTVVQVETGGHATGRKVFIQKMILCFPLRQVGAYCLNPNVNKLYYYYYCCCCYYYWTRCIK